MKVPLSWISEYIDIKLSPEELAHLLTLAGNEVSEIQNIGEWNEVVVSEVEKIDPHPNADKLNIVTVNTGPSTLEVVCGANNLYLGQKVAFAPIGSCLLYTSDAADE